MSYIQNCVKRSIRIVILAGLLTLSLPAGAFPSVTKTGDTTVDTQAMTLSDDPYGYAINGLSFQQDAVATFNGWQYVTYYNAARHVCVARRQLPSGAWQALELTDYVLSTTTDAHNIISIGVCPNDGTLHLSFDHHGNPLHYRRSQTGVAADPDSITWNASLFDPVQNYLIAGQSISGLTYPRFWQTPGGDLHFGYRLGGSGSGDWWMADYSGTTHAWSNTRQVINRSGSYRDACGPSTSRNAYLNYPGYGPDGTLHITWTWREGSGGTNHDICYAYSPDGGVTWYNNAPPLQGIDIHTAGQIQPQSLLSVLWTSTGPEVVGLATGNTSTQQLIHVNSADIIAVPIDRRYSLMNQQCQAIDSQGQVHTVMYYATAGVGCDVWASTGKDYHHYWRDLVGTLRHAILPGAAGTRPKLFIRDNGDAFVIYTTSGRDLAVQAATAAAQWTDWQVVHTEPGPFVGEALADFYRFKDGVLSVMMQDSPETVGSSTPLRILDFQLSH